MYILYACKASAGQLLHADHVQGGPYCLL